MLIIIIGRGDSCVSNDGGWMLMMVTGGDGGDGVVGVFGINGGMGVLSVPVYHSL